MVWIEWVSPILGAVKVVARFIGTLCRCLNCPRLRNPRRCNRDWTLDVAFCFNFGCRMVRQNLGGARISSRSCLPDTCKHGQTRLSVPPGEEPVGMRRIAKEVNLPPLPEPDEDGNFPALEYVRASIARSIIRERKALGLTQEQLAKLAGVRQETICRLEKGLQSPTVRTVEKIDRALNRAARGCRRRSS